MKLSSTSSTPGGSYPPSTHITCGRDVSAPYGPVVAPADQSNNIVAFPAPTSRRTTPDQARRVRPLRGSGGRRLWSSIAASALLVALIGAGATIYASFHTAAATRDAAKLTAHGQQRIAHDARIDRLRTLRIDIKTRCATNQLNLADCRFELAHLERDLVAAQREPTT